MCLYSTLILLSACASTEEIVPPEIVPGPVRGFQIQIHTTEENTDAEEMAEHATMWKYASFRSVSSVRIEIFYPLVLRLCRSV